MNFPRRLKHLLVPSWWGHRTFGKTALDAIAAAVAASESRHRGELRVAIEGPLHFAALWRGQTPRQRAEELFASLGVWDTADNCGILIYIQTVDRQVEILADRGIAARVAATEWQAICSRMEADFRAGRWLDGVLAAVARADALLAEHFPAGASNPNELPDRPLLL